MRHLTEEEIDLALDDNGEKDEGCIAIEATVEELSHKGTGTSCGHVGNTTFKALETIVNDPSKCLVRGWYDSRDNTMCGMIHIQCNDEDVAECINEAAYEIGEGGSLRPNGKSLWDTFYEFENE